VVPMIILLIIAKLVTQLGLGRLNRRHVLAHSVEVPNSFKEMIDEPTYQKSVRYTLAKENLDEVETIWGVIVLLVVLFSGVLPWSYNRFAQALGLTAWSVGAWLFVIGVLLSLLDLPLAWYTQFRLEARFGFNTTTLQTWLMDRLKGLLLGILLGYPLLVLVLKLFEWTGRNWWLWSWFSLMFFQLLMMVLAPVLILPLFNKFTPLPAGSLRDRLLRLAARTQFRATNIQVMDGSKRSRHSNAFFTGFGKFRKIVLFDTLVQQLGEVELEAVLAHEIGHYKKHHIPKTLAISALFSLAGFYCLSILVRQDWFYRSFGFEPGHVGPALLLFGLLSGIVTFWLSPLTHWWSRRHEYEADAFAAAVMKEPASLIGALRKLNEKNLSNLTPHPFYSGFYYSHPTLLEREASLSSLA
jgi:STE24 endopeptidase